MGADLGYIGSAFIASNEANAVPEYKQMIADSDSTDIIYSSLFTGIHGNYLRPSEVSAGMDPENLPDGDPSKMDFGTGRDQVKAWKHIWGSGQGIGAVKDVSPIADIVVRLSNEYDTAKKRIM